MIRRPPRSTLFPTRRSSDLEKGLGPQCLVERGPGHIRAGREQTDPASAFEALVARRVGLRSEEHTSELQSQSNLVCRLLLEKKKTNKKKHSVDATTQLNSLD